jgi:GGDEF domain-containing protein
LAEFLSLEFTPSPVYRYGGDEFVVLLPSGRVACPEFTSMLCTAARGALKDFGASISVGLATPLPGETPDLTFARADTALLWAKRNHPGTGEIARPQPASATA